MEYEPGRVKIPRLPKQTLAAEKQAQIDHQSRKSLHKGLARETRFRYK
jgi:hypothetical protein